MYSLWNCTSNTHVNRVFNLSEFVAIKPDFWANKQLFILVKFLTCFQDFRFYSWVLIRMSKNELIHEQKIQLKTRVIRIKEFFVKVRKKIKGIYSINDDDDDDDIYTYIYIYIYIYIYFTNKFCCHLMKIFFCK